MIAATLIVIALLLGYGMAVGCLLVATFGLTSASPDFVAREHRVTAGYKRVQAVVWLLCVTAGGFATCAVAQGARPWLVPVVLAASLIGMLWWNTWEARQRGMAHQILMSVVSILGVTAGYGLAKHFLNIRVSSQLEDATRPGLTPGLVAWDGEIREARSGCRR